jgi:hypothetical protein
MFDRAARNGWWRAPLGATCKTVPAPRAAIQLHVAFGGDVRQLYFECNVQIHHCAARRDQIARCIPNTTTPTMDNSTSVSLDSDDDFILPDDIIRPDDSVSQIHFAGQAESNNQTSNTPSRLGSSPGTSVLAGIPASTASSSYIKVASDNDEQLAKSFLHVSFALNEC